MGVIDLYLEYFKIFDISEYIMRLSTHHPSGLGKKYVDNAVLWIKTEEMVRSTMTNNHIPFDEVADEAAFYGPKIDVQIKSAIGREFTLATNQVDFAQAERFDLEFTNENGAKERPIIIHRAPLSTHERLIGFLLEHYGGIFPVWLSPVQVVIIPVTDHHVDYARRLEIELNAANIRVKLDTRPERMNLKIRQAQMEHIPCMLIVGDKEMLADSISLRLRSGEQINDIPFTQFKASIAKAALDRTQDFKL
jgi:threonyl-tRNA synthetase